MLARLLRALKNLLLAGVIFFEITKPGRWDPGLGWRYEARVSPRPFEESFGRAPIAPLWRAGRRMPAGARGVLVDPPLSRAGKDRFRFQPYPKEFSR